MNSLAFQFDIVFISTVLVRLLAACILGGIIGFEREYSRHTPAGFRTHILVSLGSCLAMLISLFAMRKYGNVIDIDPTRIGAQVVSGIGFLGAGAIIRHGVSVRGLTTAASIWAVACIGLACGMGFYVGAVLSTLLIWLVLLYLKLFKNRLSSRPKTIMFEVETSEENDIILSLNTLFREMGLNIKSLEVSDNASDNKRKILCNLEYRGKDLEYAVLASRIMDIKGVLKVSF